MSQNKKDNRDRSGDLSKEKSNGAFEKKNANSDGAQKKQQTPNEEVPNVGDQEKRGPPRPAYRLQPCRQTTA